MRTIVYGSKRALTASAASIIALALGMAPANAVLQIAWDFGGTTGGCVDNTGCDLNAAVGTLQLADQTINGVTVNGSIQTSTKSAALDILNTSSLSVINTTGSNIPVTLFGRKPKGRLSPEQRSFRDRCVDAGVEYLVAYCWEDVQAVLPELY